MQINPKVIENVISIGNKENYTGVQFKVSKNIFDGKFRQGNQTDSTRNNYICSSNDVYVKQGVTYIISTDIDTNIYKYAITISTSMGYIGAFYDSGWKTNQTFTFTPNQDGYLLILITTISGSAFTPNSISNNYWQIEKGSTATSYEPYINSGINVYGNEIYNKDTITIGSQISNDTKVQFNVSKNLFNAYDLIYKARSGTTYSINNSNKITVTGSDISWSRQEVTIKNLIPGQKYYIKSNVTNSSGHRAGLLINDQGVDVWNIGNETNVLRHLEFTAPSDHITVQFYTNWEGTSRTETVIFDNIILSTKDIGYEPYITPKISVYGNEIYNQEILNNKSSIRPVNRDFTNITNDYVKLFSIENGWNWKTTSILFHISNGQDYNINSLCSLTMRRNSTTINEVSLKTLNFNSSLTTSLVAVVTDSTHLTVFCKAGNAYSLTFNILSAMSANNAAFKITEYSNNESVATLPSGRQITATSMI